MTDRPDLPDTPAAPDAAGHPVVPHRRAVIVVAAVAAAFGAVVSWRTHRPKDAAAASADGGAGFGPTSVAEAAPAAGPAGSGAASAAPIRPPERIATLDGRVLTPADWKGRPLVLNFWAPWCGPCVKEMPELDRFSRSQSAPGSARALVVGLAIDDEAAVRKFLAAHPVRFPIAVLGVSGLAEVRTIANDANVALPFTAVFAPDGTLSHRKFGPTDVDELGRWVRGGA
jgi:thiol-disulfide isomerase/thioredoxin